MADLANQTCIACRGDTPKLTERELRDQLPDLPGWSLGPYYRQPNFPDWCMGDTSLQRVYAFRNFMHAITFIKVLGDLCEKEDHHPIHFKFWGKDKLSLYFATWAVKGITQNDLIMAAKVNELHVTHWG